MKSILSDPTNTSGPNQPIACFDPVSFIMDYEGGEIESIDEVREGFRNLLKCGVLFYLQGSYQRTAHALGII